MRPFAFIPHDWSAVLAIAALAAFVSGCASVKPNRGLADRVDALVAPLVEAKEFGGAIVLTRRGEVVYQRGFGMANHAENVAFTPDTPADGASLAKTFTAAGVWWLVHEGRIEIDAPVRRYIPEYRHANTTVRHLLSHSNGLPANYDFFELYFGKDEVRTTEGLLRIVARYAPAPFFAPGSRFEYCNPGFDAAALVIERVTARFYEDFLRTRFFSRLDMDASFARPARFADWPGVRTLGYRWRDGNWQLHDVYDREAFLGASNVYFSAADLARWGAANAAGTALPPAVFAAGQQRSRIGGEPSPITGLSWYCDDRGARCYNTGSLSAFHGFVYWDRERDESAAMVSNSGLPPWSAITLQRDLVDALADRPARTTAPVAFARYDRRTRTALSGTYVADGVGPVRLDADAERVRLRVGAGLEFDVFPVSREVFHVPGLDYWLAFSGDRQVPTMHIRSLFVDATARRADSK